MKRLGVLSIYEKDGVIDRSIKWYIGELLGVVDDLIVVSNGRIQKDGRRWLSLQPCRVIERANIGYDAGAHKEVLEKYCRPLDYDEILLTNDTFFGPFVPLKEIFSEMEAQPYDLWGLNRKIPLYDFIMSFFLVFRRSVIPVMVRYFQDVITDDLCRDDVVEVFERGISRKLKREGFRIGSYHGIGIEHLYRNPDYLLKEVKSPIMKKRCFEKDFYVETECRHALKYIREHSSYDISMIKESAARKYGIIFSEDYEYIDENEETFVRYYGAPFGDLDRWLTKNKSVYLFGTGNNAKDFRKIYGDSVEIRGYLVSDSFYDQTAVKQANLFPVSKVTDTDIPIVVALSKENTRETASLLQRFTNVFYLWRWEKQ